jgi:hypothetical protein
VYAKAFLIIFPPYNVFATHYCITSYPEHRVVKTSSSPLFVNHVMASHLLCFVQPRQVQTSVQSSWLILTPGSLTDNSLRGSTDDAFLETDWKLILDDTIVNDSDYLGKAWSESMRRF